MARLANQLSYRPSMTGRGSLAQRLRLWSGLILLAYVTLHYLNHSAGHVSLEAMETVLEWQEEVWGSWPGQIALYGALIVHTSLGLAKVLTIRTWRKPVWEWAQILLGLSIPWLLISHIVYTRGSQVALGIDASYKNELGLLWPDVWLSQSALLLIVWAHAMVGIHFWLRIRNGYQRWFPVLVGIAAIVPSLALTGWITAARRLYDATLLNPTGALAQDRTSFNQFIINQLKSVEWEARYAALAVVGIAVLIMVGRWVAQRFARRVKVTYGDGTTVTVASDQTLLDISRANGIAHMSVCGGRARCSTCRTLIIDGLEHCAPVTEAEKRLLDKLSADEDIRLACQCRIRGNVTVRPLIQPRSRAAPSNIDPIGWGVEREVAIMFLDIRGFSRISEKSLPYDVVFILNSVFADIGAAIEARNGYIDKFMGDGLMAIFGLSASPEEAARDAIGAALAAEAAARSSSRILTHHLSEPIRIGIGIDFGTAVIGRIGKTSDQREPSRLTAIGDTVNIAARLESATKELGTTIVTSRRTIRAAGLRVTKKMGTQASIKVHNISEPVDVVAFSDLSALRSALEKFAPARTDRQRTRIAGLSGLLPHLTARRWTASAKTDTKKSG